MTTTKAILQELSQGTMIGSYEILRLIYKGGQASVYLARFHQQSAPSIAQTLALLDQCDQTHEQLTATIRAEQLCAIKIPNPDWDDHVCDEHSFLKADTVGHSHLVKLFSPESSNASLRVRPELGMSIFADTNGQKHRLHYLVLAYLPGGSLKELLRATNQRPLTEDVAVTIAWQIADALAYLHSKLHIVHHDVSPSNILFKYPLSGRLLHAPHCVLIDLAVADRPENPQLTNTFGKQLYLPPERRNAQGNSGLSYGIDVYSLGVVLFEMLYGSIPASTDSVRRQSFQFTPVRMHLPTLSERLGDLLDTMLSQNPSRRPSMEEVREHLATRIQGKPPARLFGALNPCDMAAIEQGKRRQRMIIGGALSTGLVAAAFAATLAFGGQQPAPALIESTVTPIVTRIPTLTPRPTLVPTATIAPVAPKP